LGDFSAIGWTTAAQQCARFMTAQRSGMERFYDHVMLEYFEKLARPWHEHSHLATIRCPPKGRYLVADGNTWRIFQNKEPVSTETFQYYVKGNLGDRPCATVLGTPIHRLDLSPALKKTILAEGIPLYRQWKVSQP